MGIFKDDSGKKRLLLVLQAIIVRPYGFTKKMLAEKFDVHADTIKNDFEEIRNAGFEMDFDSNYRYSLKRDKIYKNLEELLFFTQNEQDVIVQAIKNLEINSKKQEHILRKLHSIYDISRLGGHLISKQFLTKIDFLEKALKEKKVVELVDYRSTNSSKVNNRKVEPFHVSPKEDILHAFDIEKKELRHFRISRITRVEILDLDWKYTGHHNINATDPFRIVDNKQVRVHIRMKVGGYNELVERFPLTSTYLQPAADKEGIYELDCMVNHRFYGLSNFIMGYYEQIIEILEPESLLEHIKNNVAKIKIAFLDG